MINRLICNFSAKKSVKIFNLKFKKFMFLVIKIIKYTQNRSYYNDFISINMYTISIHHLNKEKCILISGSK